MKKTITLDKINNLMDIIIIFGIFSIILTKRVIANPNLESMSLFLISTSVFFIDLIKLIKLAVNDIKRDDQNESE